MSTKFAIFVPGSKCFNTSIHCGKLMVSQNDGVHTVREWQAILPTMVTGHFPYILYGEQEGADPQRGVAIITWSYPASQSLCRVILLAVVVACNSLCHISVINLTAKAENLAIEPKLVAQSLRRVSIILILILDSTSGQLAKIQECSKSSWLVRVQKRTAPVWTKGFNLYQRNQNFHLHLKRSTSHWRMCNHGTICLSSDRRDRSLKALRTYERTSNMQERKSWWLYTIRKAEAL